MLAPIDKIHSHGNDICQLIITTICDIHSCSNCTQLLPFRHDTREMSLDCVEEALLSMRGWPGVIAVFGGNPCAHRQFPDICRLMQKLVPNQAQRGLWTNNLLKHGEICKDTFWPHGRHNLNVHGSEEAATEIRKWLPNWKIHGLNGRGTSATNHHGMMLGYYADYGYNETEWVQMRENCDINQNWSSAIAERDGRPYVYFCEVGASLDGIRGENNGILAEPGWWSWPMEKFQAQVGRCCDRGCAVPLRRRGHEDIEDTYDISPTWEAQLPERRGRPVSVQVHAEAPPATHELTDYAKLRVPK